MKCPNCGQEIPGRPCPDCGMTCPETASYCMACGTFLVQDEVDTSQDDDAVGFEDRELCPDGTCTGIIIAGKCTECGKRPEDVDEQA